ncbi:MAG: tRNA (adenosine(37)-N6)-threonylcarbamoyltransferase complex dimerization subunit type 1 TsaB [bacterium]
MQLYIDTSNREVIVLRIYQHEQVVGELIIPAERRQSEELLPGIVLLLKQVNLEMKDLTSIKVNNAGGSFTSLRIGVVTANALAYALGIPIEANSLADIKSVGQLRVAVPKYDSAPDIIVKKHWSETDKK